MKYIISGLVNHNYKTNQNKEESVREILKYFFEIIEQKMPTDKRYARKIFPQ